jgi:hypothetical protein
MNTLCQKGIINFVGFVVLKVVVMNIAILWNMTQHNPHFKGRFGVIYHSSFVLG